MLIKWGGRLGGRYAPLWISRRTDKGGRNGEGGESKDGVEVGGSDWWINVGGTLGFGGPGNREDSILEWDGEKESGENGFEIDGGKEGACRGNEGADDGKAAYGWLEGPTFSCFRHLALLFWNQTWK